MGRQPGYTVAAPQSDGRADSAPREGLCTSLVFVFVPGVHARDLRVAPLRFTPQGATVFESRMMGVFESLFYDRVAAVREAWGGCIGGLRDLLGSDWILQNVIPRLEDWMTSTVKAPQCTWKGVCRGGQALQHARVSENRRGSETRASEVSISV